MEKGAKIVWGSSRIALLYCGGGGGGGGVGRNMQCTL